MRASDALAEFGDNSIEATRLNHLSGKEREIRFRVILNDDSTSYFVIGDNGYGMDEESIGRYGKYADHQDSASSVHDTRTSCIGKFGVGAKEAAFWLGDRIHVRTCTGADTKALEITMDKDEMQFLNKQNLSAFKLKIFSRDLDKVTFGLDAIQGLNDTILEFQGSNKSFTIVVIHMRKETYQELKQHERWKLLKYELAEIYHHYLHDHGDQQTVSSPLSTCSSSRYANNIDITR